MNASEARTLLEAAGLDVKSRTQLEAMLRRWGLEPLILDQSADRGPDRH